MASISSQHITELVQILQEEDPKAVLAAANTLLRLNVHLDEARCALEALIASSGGVVKVKAIDALEKVLSAMPKNETEEAESSVEELEKQLKEQYNVG